jgi:hypothetical protein
MLGAQLPSYHLEQLALHLRRRLVLALAGEVDVDSRFDQIYARRRFVSHPQPSILCEPHFYRSCEGVVARATRPPSFISSSVCFMPFRGLDAAADVRKPAVATAGAARSDQRRVSLKAYGTGSFP